MSDITKSQFEYTNSKGVTYYLNSKKVTLNGGRQSTLFYFSKDAGRPEMSALPDGYLAREAKSGLPVVAKEK